LKSAALPAVLAAVALFVLNAKPAQREKITAAILSLAYIVGAYLLIGRFGFPPSDVSESLSYVAIGITLFVWLAPKDVNSRYGVRALFTLAFGAILLWHIRASLMSTVNLRNMLAFFCLALGVWSITERAATKVTVSTLILLPLLSATGTSLILLFSASAAFSNLVTILCALLGALLLLSLIKPDRVSANALIPYLSVFVIAFMVAGHFYLDVNPWHMVFLCVPFLVLWIRGWLPVPKHWLAEGLVLGALSAAPLGYFVWTVFKTSGPLF
jgi:hypothetical protein